MQIAKKVIESKLIQARYLVAIISAMILILLTVRLYELRLSDKDVLSVLSKEAKTLSEVISIMGENALSWQDTIVDLVIERAFTIVKILERLERTGQLNIGIMKEIAKEKGIVDVIIIDKKGKIIQSASGRFYDNMTVLSKEKLFDEMLNDKLKEFAIEMNNGIGLNMFFVGTRTRDKGLLGILIKSEEIEQFTKASGVGTLVQEIGNNPGIEYVVLQDRQGIILATRNITKMKKIETDQFLSEALEKKEVNVRRYVHEGTEVFEVVNPFPVTDENYGLFRVGISMDEVRAVRSREKQRLLITTILAIVSMSIIAVSIIVNQNYALLSRAYDRISSYTATIIESIADGMLTVDRDGRITLINKAGERIFGRSARDLIGKDITELNSDISDAITNLFRQGISRYNKEISLEVSDSKKLLSLDLFRVEDERNESCVMIVKDITEQRMIEENIRRTEQLTVMGKLASGMAHEVRNPLNAISMLAQRLNKEFKPTEKQEKYNEMVKTIVSEANRINKIMEDFLKFAKKQKPERVEINVAKLLDETIGLISVEASERNITIVKEFEDVGSIRIDGQQIKQALLNVLLNAIDAIDKDGWIKVVLKHSNGSVMIEIIDNGVGIPEDVLPRIFDLYYTTKDKGTGLGLSIVQKIVNDHNGWINVESKQGEGTSFRIYLPKEEK